MKLFTAAYYAIWLLMTLYMTYYVYREQDGWLSILKWVSADILVVGFFLTDFEIWKPGAVIALFAGLLFTVLTAAEHLINRQQ